MPPTSPPEQGSIRPPHPLADRLVARHSGLSGARILDFGTGSGRNAAALRAAGLDLTPLTDGDNAADLPRRTFVAALSTHALLHGTPQDIAQRLRCIGRALIAGGRLYATFGSTHDARYGIGKRLGARTFAPDAGDECGIAHTYFDETAVREILEPAFEPLSLEEVDVDAIAGTWAHPSTPLRGAVHWFAEAIVL